jgi:hypothetical protein
MSSNLAILVPDQATDRSTFTDRTPLLKPDFMSWVLLICFMLPSIFNLWVIFIRCCTRLMMCSIHIDESLIHMSIVVRLSRLCIPFSKKFDNLLDHLDNWHMIHDFQCDACEWACGDRNDTHYCSIMTPHRLYIYLLRLALITISHSFTFRLGFSSILLLILTTMEDKRGTKCHHSPSKKGSSSPSSASTPSTASSGSPPPPGSLSKVSSHHHRSLVLEQGRPSEKILMVDLSYSSDEENLILDTSQDAEFAKRLFGDLNRGLLGLPIDGKIIILSDSNEEKKEVQHRRRHHAIFCCEVLGPNRLCRRRR